MVLNFASLVIALAALTISTRLSHRQVTTAERATLVPVVLDQFKISREASFLETQRFIREELTDAHAPSLGLSGLPEPLRSDIFSLTWFYDDLGKLVAHGIVSEDLILGAFGDALVRTWSPLRPYVYREREIRSSTFQAYFEDLAERARRLGPQVVHARMGLLTWESGS